MRNRSFYNRFMRGIHLFVVPGILEYIVVLINMLISDLVASIW